MEIAPKTAAAATGGGVAVALVTIISWVLSFWHITLDANVGAALATILSTAGAWLAPRSHPPPTLTPP